MNFNIVRRRIKESIGVAGLKTHFRLFIFGTFIIITFFLSNSSQCLYAENDSIQTLNRKQFRFKNEILPISLIGLGAALNFSNFRYYVRDKVGNTTNISLDDYIQYAPAAEIYIADLAGIKHKNCVWDQTKYLGFSELITSAIVQSLKRITNVDRPNGGTMSFPSGHAGVAFSSAAVLFEEFYDENLPVALSGYGFSIATGALRITNNYHWISDILESAGIGILVTHLVYYLEPLKNWKPLCIKNKYLVTPSINFSNDYAALGLNIQLK